MKPLKWLIILNENTTKNSLYQLASLKVSLFTFLLGPNFLLQYSKIYFCVLFRNPTSDDYDSPQWLTYNESKSLMMIDKSPKLSKIEDIEKHYISRICWWLSVLKKEYRDLFKLFDSC